MERRSFKKLRPEQGITQEELEILRNPNIPQEIVQQIKTKYLGNNRALLQIRTFNTRHIQFKNNK